MYKSVLAAILLVGLGHGAFAADVEDPPANACEASKELTGACYEIRARYFQVGGSGFSRLWKIGSKNFLVPLAPPDAPDYPDPPEFSEILDYGVGYFGDFKVCPLADKVGNMNTVCVAAAKNLEKREYR